MSRLVIRVPQLSALQDAREERFRQELAEHLRTHFPERTAALDAAGLDQRIARALQAARGHGLSTQRELYRFLNLCGLVGWDFDSRPRNAWMRAMLVDPDVTGAGARLDRLMEHCLHRLELASHREALDREFGLHGGT